MSSTQPLEERQLYGKTQHELREATNVVRGMLPSIATLEPEALTDIVLTYADTIRPTFIPLLSLTWLRVQSEPAQHACRVNLKCEMNEDYPAMLDRFVAPLRNAEQNHSRRMEAKQRAESLIVYAQRSGLYGVSVLALLQHTSATFIPWLADAGRKLKLNDFTYPQVLNGVNPVHAIELTHALVSEAILRNVTQDLLEKPTQDVLNLLRAIFSVKQY